MSRKGRNKLRLRNLYQCELWKAWNKGRLLYKPEHIPTRQSEAALEIQKRGRGADPRMADPRLGVIIIDELHNPLPEKRLPVLDFATNKPRKYPQQ